MPSPHDRLRDAGIELAADGDRPVLRLECGRLARRLRERLVRTIGLAPVDDDVAVPAMAVELGRALASAGRRRVGVVDPQATWPCARGLLEIAAADGSPLAASWLLQNLAVLTPRAPRPDSALEQLRSTVLSDAAAFDDLVVDLTGFDHLGEQLGACGLLDAVAVVARSGRTAAGRVERWLRAVPDGRCVGVLLTGLR